MKNQPKLLKAGLLEPIVAETRNALDHKSKNDHETIRYCLLVIANLSVSRENHGVIMSQCLETLAGYSKHQDIKARQHAVFALGNICANPDNLEAVVMSGALKTLITYAFPSTDTSVNVQFQAIAALRGISTHQTLRMQVVREGGLEPLVLAAKCDSVEVQRETAATLANLALAEENKVLLVLQGGKGSTSDQRTMGNILSSRLSRMMRHRIDLTNCIPDRPSLPLFYPALRTFDLHSVPPSLVLPGRLSHQVAMARSGVLPALSHLCLSGDRERQIHAVAAMANIAEMVEGRTQKRMIEEGCIKPLLGLVDSPDVSALRCPTLKPSWRVRALHRQRFSQHAHSHALIILSGVGGWGMLVDRRRVASFGHAECEIVRPAIWSTSCTPTAGSNSSLLERNA